MKKWREKLWSMAIANHPDGQLLTNRLLVVRALLYPIDSFFWIASKSRGFQWESNSWLINDIKIGASTIRTLKNADGELYSIRTDHGQLVITRVRDTGNREVAQ